jgi:hypothetical protein
VAAGIWRQHRAAGLDQGLDDAGQLPVDVAVDPEAVLEDDRRSGIGVAPFPAGDLGAVEGAEALQLDS